MTGAAGRTAWCAVLCAALAGVAEVAVEAASPATPASAPAPALARPKPRPVRLARPAAPLDPSLEICDLQDNDLDGSIDEERGTRYVAPGGSDSGNVCNNASFPCASIGQAVLAACAGETIELAEGSYDEDVVIDKALVLHGAATPAGSTLRGSDATDALVLRASGIEVSALHVTGASGHACIRIGDAAHPGVRGVRLENGETTGCLVGIVLEATGASGTLNRILSMDIHDAVGDGNADAGTGVLLTGGNGALALVGNRIRANAGSGVRVRGNGGDAQLEFVGNQVLGNGLAAGGDGHAGIEITAAAAPRIEGNDLRGHVGVSAGADGTGLLLDHVSGAEVFCNQFRDDDTGVALAASDGTRIVSCAFTANANTGLAADAESAATASVRESLFSGNAVALEVAGPHPLDARHDWWGCTLGPGAPGCDTVSGQADTAEFIARADAPVLARRPASSGWAAPVAACYDTLQQALDAAAPRALVLVGEGVYYEHAHAEKPLEIEGLAPAQGCPASVIDATQSPGEHRPALRLHGVSGASVRNLTLRNASQGNPCGAATGEEIGLDLVDVSQSLVSGLCLSGNGVSELRVFGASDDNRIESVAIDGTARDSFGRDVCGHRSRDGILIDGGPACEGGAGAIPSGNRISGVLVRNAARGVAVRLAYRTEIAQSRISAAPAPAWDGGQFAAAILVEAADATSILDDDIGGGSETEGIRIQGRAAGACWTAPSDATGTVITGSRITHAGTGVRLYRGADDPGAPAGTLVSCNELTYNRTAIVVDWSGASGPAPNVVTLCDLRHNAAGFVNNGGETMAVPRMWWGAISGPSGGGTGTGDAVYGAVDYGAPLGSSALDDQDADGYSECQGDPDDANAQVHPGADLCDGIDSDMDGSIDEDFVASQTTCGRGACAATGQDACVGGAVQDTCVPGAPAAESCNAIDDDCDGTVDNAAAPPAVAQLVFAGTAPQALAWVPRPGATYDVVAGDVTALRAAQGDYALAAPRCLAHAAPTANADDAALPAAGEATWYLVRAVDCGGAGTYDEGAAGQVRARDAQLAPAACP